MSNGNADKVRYRNEGDEFHILWTARQALRLLDPKSGLVGVAIEGVSLRETDANTPIEEGLLVIDTAEYYGSERIEDAKQIIYCQLKHSTTVPDKPWTAAELTPLNKNSEPEGTIHSFAQRFIKLRDKYGLDAIISTVRFRFISNRPINESVTSALEAARHEKPTSNLSLESNQAFNRLLSATGLSNGDFTIFARLLDLWGRAGSRAVQDYELKTGAARYLPTLDTNVTIRLKELVRSKALPTASHDPVIRRETLLHALDIENPARLLPSPSAFESVKNTVIREQENQIITEVVKATNPVVIHAAGGVGKSVLAQRLKDSLPIGSETVIFDGFAGGAYRSPRDPRHRHDRGLVQIINELAFRGLCDPILPRPNTPDNYLDAFYRRLEQAVLAVHGCSPEALVVIILDAADNSEMAARDEHFGRSFARDLLQEALPAGVRIVALSRTERLDLLNLPILTHLIPLSSFSKDETAQHMRFRFLDIKEHEIAEFHRLTNGNPRVQANELFASESMAEVLRRLGPTVRSVDDVIADQLDISLRIVREHADSLVQIQRLCIALAALPPMVPIRVLANAAEISAVAVESFVADLGRPLLALDNAVRFRDEPVETWFRNKFTGSQADYEKLVDSLSSLATEDGYVASAIPLLLFKAGRYDDLMKLALSDDVPHNSNAVERRDIILHRITFALKSSIQKKQYPDAVKLLLRSAEEVSTNDRQEEYLIENADLIAKLSGPAQVQELVFRKKAARWFGTGHAHCAAMLAVDPLYHAEGRSFLRQAEDWLLEWSRQPDDQRREEPIEDDDIAALTTAYLHLVGPKAAVEELKRWKPRKVSFSAGRLVASRLIDAGQFNVVTELARLGEKNVFLILAIAYELAAVGKMLPAETLQFAVKYLRRFRIIKDHSFSEESYLSLAVITLAEGMSQAGTSAGDVLALLEVNLPMLPTYAPSHPYGNVDERDLILRAYCLSKALSGSVLDVIELMPKQAKEAIEKENGDHNRTVREFREVFGSLLPWYQTRASFITGHLLKSEINAKFDEAAELMKKDVVINYRQRSQEVSHLAAKIWFDTILRADAVLPDLADKIEHWLDEVREFVFIPVWTDLARKASHSNSMRPAALNFTNRAKKIIEKEHMSANSAADSYALLARAVLPISLEDARAYFKYGLEALDRLGDEARDRLAALCTIATKAGKIYQPEPESAYRLARIGEVIYEYDSHKFPWDTLAQSITDLCPTSGLSIISRWHDRDKGWIGETFPRVIIRLLERGQIESKIAAAMFVIVGTGGYWSLDEFGNNLFVNESDENNRIEILNLLVRDVEFEGTEERDIARLIEVTSKNHITHQRLKALFDYFHDTRPTFSDQHGAPPPSLETSTKIESVDWNRILSGKSFLTSEDIDYAVTGFRAQGPPWYWEELYLKMRAVVSVGDRLKHFQALIGSAELEVSHILDALKDGFTEWTSSPAVLQEQNNLIDKLLTLRSAEFIDDALAVRRLLYILKQIGENPTPKLVKIIRSAADHIDSVPAGNLYDLAERLTQQLEPEQAFTILTFGLDRFERLLKEADGDGPWNQDLTPPIEMYKAVARFLWAFLGSPEASIRWRAVHAVRRLSQLKQKNVLDALIHNIDDLTCPFFSDTRLPFYPLHARLYLLIALSRSAIENPDMLISEAHVFERHALNDIPHVLIRRLAADIALALDTAQSGIYPPETVKALRRVNVTPFTKTTEVKRAEGPFHWKRKHTEVSPERFHFDDDIERYWFDSLAKAFGLPTAAVTEEAESWIMDRWHYDAVWKWNDEPRRYHSSFRDYQTYARHGEYPKTDRLSLYLSYHAMFCVAGEMLNKYPLVKDQREDPFAYWLRYHYLTRLDGRWIYDRRDPQLLERRPWQGQVLTETWRWSIKPTDFDNVLGIAAEKIERLTLWGNWTIRDKERREIISISSALVSRNYSLDLLRALQTAEDSHSYRIPIFRDSDGEIRHGEYRMTGWVTDWNSELHLDRSDPLAGKIPYPGVNPARNIIRMFKLVPDEEKRCWYFKSNEGDVPLITSQLWGDWKEEDKFRDSFWGHGKRLTVKFDFLKEILTRVRRDIIIEVEIERENVNDKRSEYVPPYFRIYVIRNDGRLYTIDGHREIG